MSNSLLLLSDHSEDTIFAEAMARSAGLGLRPAGSAMAAASELAAGTAGCLLIEASTQAKYQQFEEAIRETVGLYSDRIPPGSLHFISSVDLNQASYLIASPLFSNFILRKSQSPEAAGEYYGRIARSGINRKLEGLQTLLAPGCKIQTLKLTNTVERPQAVDAIRQFVSSAKFNSRVSAVIAQAIDELIMNAIFDAPVDDLGRQLYKQTPRSASFRLDGKQGVEVQVGFDGNFLGLSCVDQFGSLSRERLLEHISKSYQSEAYTVKSGAAAGIGLASVFQAGGSMLFVSENQVRTSVSLFFQRAARYRDFQKHFRFISTQFIF